MRQVFVQAYQPDPEGPTFGRNVGPTEMMKLQNFLRALAEHIARDFITTGAAVAQVGGFDYELAGGLSLEIAAGHALDALGRSFDTYPADESVVVQMPAAHAANPRIDLVYATLIPEQDAENVGASFRRIRTPLEFEQGVDPYPPENVNVPTERRWVAAVAVRQGVAAADPVAPAAGANEVPLYEVRVEANAVALTADKVTDVRPRLRSLYQLLQDVLGLQGQVGADINETIDDRVAALLQDSTSVTKAYNDAGNALTLSVPAEYVQDVVGAFMSVAANNGLSLVYDDVANTLVLSLAAATQAAQGAMSAADKTKLDNATDEALANSLARRTATGDCSFALLNVLNYLNLRRANGTGANGLLRSHPNIDRIELASISNHPLSLVSNEAERFRVENNGLMRAFNILQLEDSNFLSLHGNGVSGSLRAHPSITAIELAVLSNHKLSFVTNSIERMAIAAGGNVSISNNLSVTGSLSKGSGTFHIDHPLDPSNKDLIHGFIESPEYLLLYRGKVRLENGRALVQIDEASRMTPGTFAALVQDAEVQSLHNKTGFARVRATEITDGQFEIICEDESSSDEINWLVAGARKDPFVKLLGNTDEEGRLVPEALKPELTAEEQAMLEPLVEVVEAEEAAPDVVEERTVPSLQGKRGYPRHSTAYPAYALPTRTVTIRTVAQSQAEGNQD